jgi:Uma2 family endonuclease
MPETARRWTAEMVRALPDDGNRYEVIDGELFVTPAPRALHQRAVGELFVRLWHYVRAAKAGEAMTSPADIEFREDRLVQPDIFVITLRPGGRKVREWQEIKSLVLAVEVLSPSTARADRQVKRRLYQEEPVGEYWIVDLDARVIERWRHGDQRPEVPSDRLAWPAPSTPALEIDLPAFFRDVLDD